MNIFSKISFFIIPCLAAFSAMAALTPYVDATGEAKEKNQYMVVVWNGSDWSPEAREFTSQFEELSKGQKLPVIWCEWDERENVSQEEKMSEYFKKMAPPSEVWNIPAVLIVSPEKQLVYKIEGVTVPDFKKILPLIPAIIDNQEKADRYWEQADQAKGDAALRLYDKGLSLLPRNVSKERKDILEKVKKLDPEDKSGILLKADFSHVPYLEKIEKMVKEEKDISGAQKFVNDRLAIRGLSKDQTQKLMAGRFLIARLQNDRKESLRQLDAIKRIAPKTEMGRGADYYTKFLTQPIILKGNKFNDYAMRHEFTPAIMDVSPYIKSPGKYKISINFFGDRCDFRNPKIMSGKRVVANTPSDMKDKVSDQFILDVGSVPSSLTLVIEIKGGGWFHSLGEIVITKEQ